MVIELVIRTEDSEDVWTLSSPVALTRRKPFREPYERGGGLSTLLFQYEDELAGS